MAGHGPCQGAMAPRRAPASRARLIDVPQSRGGDTAAGQSGARPRRTSVESRCGARRRQPSVEIGPDFEYSLPLELLSFEAARLSREVRRGAGCRQIAVAVSLVFGDAWVTGMSGHHVEACEVRRGHASDVVREVAP